MSLAILAIGVAFAGALAMLTLGLCQAASCEPPPGGRPPGSGRRVLGLVPDWDAASFSVPLQIKHSSVREKAAGDGPGGNAGPSSKPPRVIA